MTRELARENRSDDMPDTGIETDASLFRALVDNSIDVITVFDEDGVILYESPSVERELGAAPVELVGRSVLELIHPEDEKAVDLAIRGTFETKKPHSAEFRTRHQNGEWRWLQGITRAIEHGGRHLVIANTRDVTRARAAQRETEMARKLFEKVFSASRNMQSISLPDSGVIADVNDAWTSMFGYTRAEAVGRTAVELGCWGDQAAERERIVERLLAEGRVRDQEVTLFGRGGEARTIRLDGELVELDGELRVLFSGIDVTDELRTQAQLRQSQKMEALGQLTGGVAHDFNNLLGVIMGNGELLRDMFEEDAEVLEYIDPVLRASERGASLTQQLLAFARRQALAPESVRINEHAERMRPMLQASVNENVSIRIEARSDLWTCRVDPSQLENALLNLVLNARDAMPAGGAVLIHACNRRVTEQEAAEHSSDIAPGDYVAVTVSDTGLGIDDETLAHVFEPFFTTKAPGKGTGLGLSMVFGFVNQTGGAVEIESRIGEGTSVRLLLPRTQDDPSGEAREAPVQSPTARGETVLILEDNDALRSLLTRQLAKLGYAYLEARDEHELQQLLQTDTQFDLVVSDVVLTGTRLGPELARAILHHRPGTAVLFISGYPSWAQDLATEAHVLNKPFRMEDFALAVREALDHAERSPARATPD